ncbi:N-acetyltransferase [candidate division KSB1 bacterium]|nr:N-acetyltransferase [candidate division KSB1 bacterium]MCH8285734.1 N-acetyltransferase [candidate division KSB1 bacterium]
MKKTDYIESFVDSTARIGKNTKIGKFCVIANNVSIGKNCAIDNHVVIYPGTTIGDSVNVQDHTIIGKPPISGKRSAKRLQSDRKTVAQIAKDVQIGAHVIIYNQTKIEKSVLIADSAAVRERVTIGEETIVGRSVTIENDTNIGCRTKLETGCYITAYSEVGNDCFIAPMVMTSNDNYLGRTKERFKHYKGVTVKNGGRIGVGAVILPGIEIGEEGVVAAGSVVTMNVEKKTLVMGSPAKYLRDVPEEQWAENQ